MKYNELTEKQHTNFKKQIAEHTQEEIDNFCKYLNIETGNKNDPVFYEKFITAHLKNAEETMLEIKKALSGSVAIQNYEKAISLGTPKAEALKILEVITV
jgi:hypothetical protein